jgi:hypothetical protein
MPKRCPVIFDLADGTKACAWAARPGSTSPGQSAWRAKWGRGKTIVTILCDYGSRYQSKIYNPTFLKRKGPAGAGMAGPRAGPFLPSSRTHEAACASGGLALAAVLALSDCGARLGPGPARGSRDWVDGGGGAGPRLCRSGMRTGRKGRSLEIATGAPDRTDLRKSGVQLAKWRAALLNAQNANSARIATLRQQIAALGPPRPKAQTEAEEIAAPTRRTGQPVGQGCRPGDFGRRRGLSPRRRADPTRSTASCANGRRTSCCSFGPRP